MMSLAWPVRVAAGLLPLSLAFAMTLGADLCQEGIGAAVHARLVR